MGPNFTSKKLFFRGYSSEVNPMFDRAAHAITSTTLETSGVVGMMTSAVGIIKTDVQSPTMTSRDGGRTSRSFKIHGNETYVNRCLARGRDPRAGRQWEPAGRFRRRS